MNKPKWLKLKICALMFLFFNSVGLMLYNISHYLFDDIILIVLLINIIICIIIIRCFRNPKYEIKVLFAICIALSVMIIISNGIFFTAAAQQHGFSFGLRDSIIMFILGAPIPIYFLITVIQSKKYFNQG